MCCTAAAAGGHLDVLEWAVNSGAPMDNLGVVRAAIRNSRTNLLCSVFRLWPHTTTWHEDDANELMLAAIEARDPSVLSLVSGITGNGFSSTAVRLAVSLCRLDVLELTRAEYHFHYEYLGHYAFGHKADVVRQWLLAQI
jgi:hypothetical protein